MGGATPASEKYDAIVIGSGQGGNPLAEAMAAAGRRVAMIERGAVGGTCINIGCTPTKTMVASARIAWLARRAAGYGVHLGPPQVDLGEVRRRKQGVVDSFRDGKQRRLEATKGLDLIHGEATFEDARNVSVALRGGGARRLVAEKIFINAGCRPARPSIKGVETIEPLDSTSIMELDEVPSHLLVIGGGYVGLEFGQMFRRFGSEVTIVQRGPVLLGHEDPDVAREVAAILEGEGVKVLLNASTTEVRHEAQRDNPIALTVRTPAGERVLRGSHLLYAAGRTPNTERLGLDKAGVTTDRGGFIQVSETLETSSPGIYALGDVKGGPAFTHISYDDFRILRTNLLDGGKATTKDRFVPYTVFIDPQLGRVGMTEHEARTSGLKVKVYTMPMSYVARAIEVGETRGLMKGIVDAATDRIIGYAVLGIEGGELMSAIEIAMMGGVTASSLREATFAHPVLVESLNTLFSSTPS